jgi:putrescine transport system permease protein
MSRRPTFLVSCLAFGFAFFYVPIVSMIVFSFNDSRLATVWGGFSVRWYARLLEDERILEAAWLSVRIALVSATLATVLGTMAGLALARFRRFRGRTAFAGLVTAPMVMPEVITGIATLLFFIMLAEAIGWPGQRGFTTVTIAHATFSMAYVATIVRARLASTDLALEEAAADLGSRPWKVLRDVTLPVIAPAILSGWLLAFTISLDDVVITSFTTGPGATTLPILIWSKVKLGVTPDVNALATIVVVAVGIGVVVAGIVLERAAARRERDAQAAAGGW